MDDESGEFTERAEVTGIWRSESQMKRLVWGCWREAGSSFIPLWHICFIISFLYIIFMHLSIQLFTSRVPINPCLVLMYIVQICSQWNFVCT